VGFVSAPMAIGRAPPPIPPMAIGKAHPPIPPMAMGKAPPPIGAGGARGRGIAAAAAGYASTAIGIDALC
jgi:hypothetical protein